jgi:hypothetical protein
MLGGLVVPWLRDAKGRDASVAYNCTHLEKLRHLASLLLRFCTVFLLHHAQSRYRQLELHFELVLSSVSYSYALAPAMTVLTISDCEGAMLPDICAGVESGSNEGWRKLR